MNVDEALAHANCSAALSASPEHVSEAIQVLAARVQVLGDWLVTAQRRINELEAEREAVGTEWGVRFPAGDVRTYEDRLSATLAARHGQFPVPVEAVERDILAGPWRVVSS